MYKKKQKSFRNIKKHGKYIDNRTKGYYKSYKNGLLHSIDDEPAIFNRYGKFWFKNGLKHRDNDKPAEEYNDHTVYENHRKHWHSWQLHYNCNNIRDKRGLKIWYENNEIHRNGDKPAYIGNGIQIYYKNGMIHRDNDEPAFISGNGKWKTWYKNNNIHRNGDKPAVICNNVKCWYKNGLLHRENNKPAVSYLERVYNCGSYNYNTDRIAGISKDGLNVYYYMGKLHRTDDYSFIKQGVKIYCFLGNEYTDKNEFEETVYMDMFNRNRKNVFNFFHIWYEKIYENINSKFVQLQINKSYDDLLATNKLYLDSS